jgi:hypothetical protein
MPRHHVATYSMQGHVSRVLTPPTPPPPAEELTSPPLKPKLDEADMEEFASIDVQFMANVEQEEAEEAIEEDREEGEDDDDLEDSSDGARQKQKAIVESFETSNKLQDSSRTQEDFDATWRRIVEISIERAPIEERASS